jgi:regulator of sigma E protease
MFDFLPAILRTPVAFGIVLGVLVFIHELGHYLAARWCGVHVETFSIGFGRALVSWTDRLGTVWKIAWLPLGGYVKLHGLERPEDVSDEVKARWQPGRTFHGKSLGSRAIVIAAGPIANFVLAAVLFTGLFAFVGRGTVVPVVGEVIAGSAASHGGLNAGDRITAIDGRPIQQFQEIQGAVAASPGRPIHLVVTSGGASHELTVTPDPSESNGHTIGVLGIRAGAIEYQRLSPAQAVPAGLAETWNVTRQTLVALWGMVAGSQGAGDLSGPLGIARLSGQVAALGVASLVSLIAVLSTNLGLFNLFPIPVLDGGHLVFYLAEALRGRPLPPRAQEYGFRAGLALLAGLFVFATWNDLSHIGIVRWVASLIG